MRKGLSLGSRVRDILEVRGNLKAIEAAMGSVKPGELLVLKRGQAPIINHFNGRWRSRSIRIRIACPR